MTKSAQLLRGVRMCRCHGHLPVGVNLQAGHGGNGTRSAADTILSLIHIVSAIQGDIERS